MDFTQFFITFHFPALFSISTLACESSIHFFYYFSSLPRHFFTMSEPTQQIRRKQNITRTLLRLLVFDGNTLKRRWWLVSGWLWRVWRKFVSFFTWSYQNSTEPHKQYSILGFHINQKFGEAFPDSALLIAVGFGLGFLLKWLQVGDNLFRLDSSIFFLYLLPPIIFDAG